ncbi:porin family protein [Hymenobacter cellulosilyticus]|uniref:PorT family protein n=1 Tax=Hymenobacter cellulosilyticus TaxID=2932248 RepID=A0A8T9QBK2_9BACT|nr:porin family protein [Hymenobacter cellulosilyticus]UOQ74916.1 PorT family protein [Hymenobacter cellulosilyticus]
MKNLHSFSVSHFCRRGARLLSLAFLLSLTNQAQAQNGPRLGLKAGLNLATYTGGSTLARQAGWQPGIAAGALLTYPLSNKSGLQMEALYSQKGMRQSRYNHLYRDPAFYSADNIYRVSLAYLDMPVLYTYGPGSSGSGFFVAAGPQLSLALSKREFVRPRGEAVGGPHEEMISADRRLAPVAAGYVAGLGYQLTNGLGAEVRYTGDFTRVFSPSSKAGSVYNGVLQLQLRFLLGAKNCPGTPAEPRPRPVSPAPQPYPATRSTAYLDSLSRDPKVRRVVEVLSILSWLDFHVGSRPVYRSGPGVPPPTRRQPAPRTRAEHPVAY